MIKKTIDDMQKILTKLKFYDLLLEAIYDDLDMIQMGLDPYQNCRVVCETVNEQIEEIKLKIEETQEKI